MITFYIAAMTLSVIVGAVLQYWFSLRAESRRNAQAKRTEAYADLIKAIATLAKQGAEATTESSRTALALYADARARVAIYGSAAVVSRLAAFLRVGEDFHSATARQALAEVITAMRADGVGTKQPLLDADVRRVVFGTD